MTFTELVHNKLDIVFQRNNLQSVDEFENYIKLKSDKVTIALYYDEKENTGSLYAGKNDASLLLIDGSIINKFFVASLKDYFIIPEKTKEDFVNNIFSFFNNKGRLLIEGDIHTLEIITRYFNQENEKYTTALLQEQNLLLANGAWDKGDYKSFMDYIDKTNRQTLPSSYQLKYKIANQRI